MNQNMSSSLAKVLLMIAGLFVILIVNLIKFHSDLSFFSDKLKVVDDMHLDVHELKISTKTREGTLEVYDNRTDIFAGDICSAFGSKNALDIWFDNKELILEASLNNFPAIGFKNKLDLPQQQVENFTAWLRQMFAYLTPFRLQKSIKNLPDLDSMNRVIDILEKRRSHLLKKRRIDERYKFEDDESAPPPLKIFVAGGSVTLGSNCGANPINKKKYWPTDCNWPDRLQR